MRRKPLVAIVGAGNLASALAPLLKRAGYTIEMVASRPDSPSQKRAQRLAKEVEARSSIGLPKNLKADVVWFCVPDAEIAKAAQKCARDIDWKGRLAVHSSGALTSDELESLRNRGAAVASMHPLMTFVRGSRPSLQQVPFAVEGDAVAVHLTRQFVKDLGGHAYSIHKDDKAAYHAWGTFASPLFTALLATTEEVAAAAGVRGSEARRRMIPILRQTLANYESWGASGAFSGPIVRGDVETVRRHLRVLGRIPAAHGVYRSLALAALRYLPCKNKTALRKALL
jgi:predicted short-subunit dehydrogenase-like oxidoreductase (DUF2520 family)